MKVKRYWILAVVVATVLVGGIALSVPEVTDEEASNVWTDRSTLAGLEGVLVLIEPLKPDAKKHGLTEAALETDVELRLRQYGIKVVSEQERLLQAGRPYLYVNVNAMIKEDLGTFAVSVEVALYQNVRLERDPTIEIAAATWERSEIVTGGLVNLPRVRDIVKDLVDKFINDYLAANPKEPAKQKGIEPFESYKQKDKKE